MQGVFVDLVLIYAQR